MIGIFIPLNLSFGFGGNAPVLKHVRLISLDGLSFLNSWIAAIGEAVSSIPTSKSMSIPSTLRSFARSLIANALNLVLIDQNAPPPTAMNTLICRLWSCWIVALIVSNEVENSRPVPLNVFWFLVYTASGLANAR